MPTTVILGTGIIGLSTAYYLSNLADSESDQAASSPDTTPTAGNTNPSRPKHEIHLVEPCPELFASASGKAAGFLAKDWFAPAVAPLGAFSFDLHRELAQAHDGAARWGWCESVSYSLDRDESDVDEDEVRDDEAKADRILDGASEAEGIPREKLDGVGGHEQTNRRGSGNHDERATGPAKQGGESKGRTQSTDLQWLMDGSSRATLLEEPYAEADSTANGDAGAGVADEHPRWLRAKQSALQAISDRSTTGQVDPLRLCQFLLAECQSRGVTLHHPARATQMLHTESATDSPTVIRIEYLEPQAAASAEDRKASPNSLSPPPDAATTSSLNSSTTRRGGMATDLPTAATQADLRMPVPSGPLPIGSWASLTSPLERVGDPEALVGGDYFDGAMPTRANGHAILSEGMKDENKGSIKQPSRGRTVDIQCDSLVIAAGCWTPRVYRTLFPNAGRIPRVTALAGHSVVLKSKRWRPAEPNLSQTSTEHQPQKTSSRHVNEETRVSTSLTSSNSSGRTVKAPSAHTSGPLATPATTPGRVCHAIFTGDHAGYSPEIFSRLNGDIWLGGLNSSSIPLPPLASHAVPEASALATLLHTAHALCGSPGRDAASLQVVRSALCFRPVAPTGRPVLARMHEADLGDGAKVPGGVFVATGHGPWGISLSLGTGYVMGEMVLGKETSVDVRALGRWEAQAP